MRIFVQLIESVETTAYVPTVGVSVAGAGWMWSLGHDILSKMFVRCRVVPGFSSGLGESPCETLYDQRERKPSDLACCGTITAQSGPLAQGV